MHTQADVFMSLDKAELDRSFSIMLRHGGPAAAEILNVDVRTLRSRVWRHRARFKAVRTKLEAQGVEIKYRRVGPSLLLFDALLTQGNVKVVAHEFGLTASWVAQQISKHRPLFEARYAELLAEGAAIRYRFQPSRPKAKESIAE